MRTCRMHVPYGFRPRPVVDGDAAQGPDCPESSTARGSWGDAPSGTAGGAFGIGEFTEMHGYTNRERAFAEFLECGGLPGVDPSRDSGYREDYLQGVYNTILVKDVLRHANVGDPSKVESIARFLFSNIGNVTNRSSVARGAAFPNPRWEYTLRRWRTRS